MIIKRLGAIVTATNTTFDGALEQQIEQFKRDRVYKRLNYLESPQSAWVKMEGRGDVLILSSNNYLGLCDEPAVIEAGIEGLRRFGAGTGSVRFICGTFTIHRELEEALGRFVGAESSLCFVSAWNANEGLTATVVEDGDFVISDALNHASIIDSIRLAKAITKCTDGGVQACRHGRPAREAAGGGQRAKRRHDLDATACSRWKARSRSCRTCCRSRATHDAIVLVIDDSHATGVLGKNGRGTAEHFGVLGEVDVITSTLGKALGGAAGGFVAGSAALCRLSDAAVAPAALLERAATDGGRERAGCR